MCQAYITYNMREILIDCEEQILDLSPKGYERLVSFLGIFLDEGKISA